MAITVVDADGSPSGSSVYRLRSIWPSSTNRLAYCLRPFIHAGTFHSRGPLRPENFGSLTAGSEGREMDGVCSRGSDTFGADTDSYHGIGGSESGRSLLPHLGQSGGTARQAVHSTTPGMSKPATSSRAARYKWIKLPHQLAYRSPAGGGSVLDGKPTNSAATARSHTPRASSPRASATRLSPRST